MKCKYIIVMLFAGFLLPAVLFAENVSGLVKDTYGEPIIGANVVVEGTSRGTVTDVDGLFSFSAPENSSLVISYIGYVSQTVKAAPHLSITLKENAKALDEVVVVGYGTQKAKDLTAPISVIQGNELSKQITANAAQALQGKVAGVQVINNGAPGNGATVKIRGVGSIGDYAKPLYIVDGTFVDNIDFISANDIESMSVLKDASASAIYGVRAANGVVLIATKKGVFGKPAISYDGYAGMQTPVNVMPMANREQYVELLNLANTNTLGYEARDPSQFPANTNWYDNLLRNAMMHSHSLDVNGMTDKSNYSVGINYFQQDGIMDAENSYERYNLRGRFEHKASSWLKVGASAIMSNYNKQNANENAFRSAYWNPPVYPVYNDDNTEAYPVKFDAPQNYGYGNSYGNPVASAYYHDVREETKRIMYSTFAELNIIDQKLAFKISYNQDYSSQQRKDFQPESFVGGSQGRKQSILTETFENKSMQILDNLLTYTDSKDKHSYTLLLGHSLRTERMNNLWGSAVDVPGTDEQSKYLTTGSYKDQATGDGAHTYKGVSAFARGTYNYADKYLLSLTFRADASSKYQQKWGYFPSLGMGWVLSEEDFMRSQKVFDYLKVRASWGMLGNDNIPANAAQIIGSRSVATSSAFGDILVDGVGAQTVVQNYLRWEVVSEYNAGLDASFLKRRLQLGMDFYYRVTDNVVFSAPVSSGGGKTDLLGNNGKVLNDGIELTLGWTDKITEKLSYNIGLNTTFIHNEVLALDGRDYIPGGEMGSNFATRTEVGHPIGSFYGYKVIGVWQAKNIMGSPGGGYLQYWDDGDYNMGEEDKKYLGSPIPWLMGGIDLGLNYDNWDFNITLQGQIGNKIFNQKRLARSTYPDGNYDLDYYQNAWRGKGSTNTYPSPEAFNSGLTQLPSSFFVEDGSYCRIQNVQLGYTFGNNKVFNTLRLYLSAQRPLTIFGYNGFSPEVSGSPIATGIDNNVYPMSAVYSVGLKVNF